MGAPAGQGPIVGGTVIRRVNEPSGSGWTNARATWIALSAGWMRISHRSPSGSASAHARAVATVTMRPGRGSSGVTDSSGTHAVSAGRLQPASPATKRPSDASEIPLPIVEAMSERFQDEQLGLRDWGEKRQRAPQEQ